MISKINTAAIRGIEGVSVSIEVDIANGIPNFLIVGMVDTTVREARDRVKAAIGNSQCKYPNSRVVVSLMPANLKKKGAHFDLPIAMGILAASKQVLTSQLDESGFIGQLSLDGEIGKVNGVLPMAIEMKKSGIRFSNHIEKLKYKFWKYNYIIYIFISFLFFSFSKTLGLI